MLLSNLNLLATAPGGVARLRELILTLAVQGKLVPQDSKDEPASELLKKIRAEKDRLIAEGKIKRDKPLAEIAEEEPFGLASNWRWSILGVLASKLTDGSHNPPGDSGAGYPMLSSQNVWEDGVIDFTAPSRYVSESDFVIENRRTYATAGDVLLTIVASLGRSGVVPANAPAFVLQRSVAVIRTGLDPAFLSLFLRSPVARAFYDLHAKGTAQKGIYLGKLSTMPIPVPPLAEQSRIVTRVEELMRLCDALEAKARLEATQHEQLVRTLLGILTASTTPEELTESWHRVATHFDLLLDRPEAVDALEQTILQLAVRGLLSTQRREDGVVEVGDLENDGKHAPVSWSSVRLADVLLDLRYGTSVKCGYEVAGVPVLRIPNLQAGYIDTNNLKFGLLDEGEKEKLRLEPGDLLIIRSNGSASLVGSVAMVRTESKGFAFAGYLVRARLKREYVQPEYMVLVMQTHDIRQQIEAPIRTTSGVKNINSTEISRLSFSLPPLAEQSRIVARVASLRALCADLRQRLTAARTQQALLAEVLVQGEA